MKFNRMRNRMSATLAVMLISVSVQARSGRDALEYMKSLSKPSETVSKEMWDYVRAAAHSKNAAQVENKRRSLIRTVADARTGTARQPAFEDDTQFRDSMVRYLNMLHIILTEDYGKIVDMEEVAEQSYDQMEAYLLAKKKANQKLDEAGAAFRKAEEEYASRHKIRLIFTEDEISKNLKKAGEVMGYYNDVYLIFFKSYKQEMYLMEALNRKDLSKIEQSRLALLKTTEEGLDKLSDLDDYADDESLIDACEKYLKFAEDEAEEQFPVATDFLLKQDQFDAIKKAFDLKKPTERTREDIDLYNARVREMNEGAQRYNEIMQKLNQNRGRTIDGWNQNGRMFIDRHVPK